MLLLADVVDKTGSIPEDRGVAAQSRPETTRCDVRRDQSQQLAARGQLPGVPAANGGRLQRPSVEELPTHFGVDSEGLANLLPILAASANSK